MDWNKTKTYLIVALIFTNIVLGYFYFIRIDSKVEAEEEDNLKLENVVSLLETDNILVKADVSVELPTVVGIKVEFEEYDLSEIAEKIFPTSSRVQRFNDNHYYDNKFELKVINEKFLEFDLKDHSSLNIDNSTGDEARYYADKFIEYIGFKTDETVFSSIIKENQYYKIEYIQKSNDSLIMDAKMTVRVNNRQVIGFSRIWINTLEELVSGNKFIDVGNALYSFKEKIYLDNPDRQDKIVVEDIFVGYRLINSTSRVEISNISSGTVDPYWIIKTNHGEYMIEALKK